MTLKIGHIDALLRQLADGGASWKRLWSKRGAEHPLSRGFTVGPAERWWDGEPVDLPRPLSEFDQVRCAVLLGEAGSGKSNAIARDAMRRSSENAPVIGLALRTVGSAEELRFRLEEVANAISKHDTTPLVTVHLDGLDECRLVVRNADFVVAQWTRTIPVDRVRLRIGCRATEWPSHLETALIDAFGEEHVVCLQLLPLTQLDVATYVSGRSLEAEAFLSEVLQRDLGALASRPLTLIMLTDEWTHEQRLPRSQASLYEKACLRQCSERSTHRSDLRVLGQLTPRQRMVVCGRIALLFLLCGKSAFRHDSSDGSRPDELGRTDVCGLDFDDATFTVNDVALLDVIDICGLFTSATSGSVRFCHQSYTEFLAAWYLAHRKLSIGQLRSMLLHGTSRRFAPALRAIVAWLITRNDEALDLVAELDPALLLAGDLAALAEHQRSQVVDALLAAARSHKLLVDYGIARAIRHLNHASLAQQVGRSLRKGTSASEKRLALEFVEHCSVRELVPQCLKLALDSKQDYSTRTLAAERVAALGSVDDRCKLRVLVDDPVDAEDRFKAIALRALFPSVMTPSELLAELPRPSEHFFGEYVDFLHRLPANLSVADYPAALSWVVRSPSLHGSSLVLEDLASDLLALGWGSAHIPEVRKVLAAAVVARLVEYEPPWPSARHGNRDHERPSRETLRAVVSEIVETCSIAAERIVYSRSTLLDSADLKWILASLSQSQSRRVEWARLFHCLAWRSGTVEVWELAVEAAEHYPEIAVLYAEAFSAVELDTDRARLMRDDFARFMALVEPKHEPRLERSTERIEHGLLSALQGDAVGWLRATQELAIGTGQTRYPSHWESDPNKWPGWLSAESALKSQFAEAAMALIGALSPRSVDWQDLPRRATLSACGGFRAFALLARTGMLERVDDAAWRAWAPVLLGFPAFDSGEYACDLARRAYAHGAGQMREALKVFLRNEADSDIPWVTSRLDGWSDDAVVEVLLEHLRSEAVRPGTVSHVIDLLVSKGSAEAEKVALEICDNRDPRQQELSTGAARVLLRWNFGKHWNDVSKRFRDIAFATRVVERLAASVGHGYEDLLWSPNAAVEFYEWVTARYTPTPEHLEYAQVSRHEMVRSLQSRSLLYLQKCGDPDALLRLGRAVEAQGDAGPYWALIEAEESVLSKSWQPHRPDAILKVLSQADARIVETGDQLESVVVESLGRIERSLRRETPRLERLYEGRAPKRETALTNFLKDELSSDLFGRGVVAGREVRIQDGLGDSKAEITDIHIDAISVDERRVGRKHLKLIIEVKGDWNAGLHTDLKRQLHDRYLQHDCDYGIYIVGLFGCRSGARRSRLSSHIDEVRERFDAEARRLSVGSKRIRVVVLDLRLPSAAARAPGAPSKKSAATRVRSTRVVQSPGREVTRR